LHQCLLLLQVFLLQILKDSKTQAINLPQYFD